MSTVFRVMGVPAPQGSFRPMTTKAGKAIIVPGKTSSYLRYRADIRAEAERAMGDHPLYLKAVALTLTFVFQRPQSHYLPANGVRPEPMLRHGAPRMVASIPDLDKLCRAVMDALTGLVYKDDAQVVSLAVAKVYTGDQSESPRTLITVYAPEEDD